MASRKVVTVTFAGSIFAITEGSAPPAEQPDWLVRASMQHPSMNERSQSDNAFLRRCRYMPRTPPVGDDELGATIKEPFFENMPQLATGGWVIHAGDSDSFSSNIKLL
jgi:hypothetical protein